MITNEELKINEEIYKQKRSISSKIGNDINEQSNASKGLKSRHRKMASSYFLGSYISGDELHKFAQEYKGINNDIYDEFVNLLSVIDDYTTKDDLAVSFKYTLERDFSTPIITNSLINLSAEDIKNNVENEKKILLICKIIKIVAQTSNYHDVNNDFANNIKIMEDALQNILNELSK